MTAPPRERRAAADGRHDELDRELVVVSGKGGVGKSTVAAALGLCAARRGRRALVVEVAARDDVARAVGGERRAHTHVERRLGERLDHVSLDPRHALQDYLRRQLPRPAAALLLGARVFGLLTAATPGLAELLTIGKVWELARHDPDAAGGRRHDVVILDAPATGHALALLRAPATFASATRTGPVTAQARRIDAFLRDPARTAVVAVAAAEELAVHETLYLREQLRARMGKDLSRVVVNAVLPDRFSGGEVRALQHAAASRACRAALSAAARAARQRQQLRTLRAGLTGVPVVTLPYLFEPELRRADLELLSHELERRSARSSQSPGRARAEA